MSMQPNGNRWNYYDDAFTEAFKYELNGKYGYIDSILKVDIDAQDVADVQMLHDTFVKADQPNTEKEFIVKSWFNKLRNKNVDEFNIDVDVDEIGSSDKSAATKDDVDTINKTNGVTFEETDSIHIYSADNSEAADNSEDGNVGQNDVNKSLELNPISVGCYEVSAKISFDGMVGADYYFNVQAKGSSINALSAFEVFKFTNNNKTSETEYLFLSAVDNHNVDDFRLLIVPCIQGEPVPSTVFSITTGDLFSMGVSKIKQRKDPLEEGFVKTEFGALLVSLFTEIMSKYHIIAWSDELDVDASIVGADGDLSGGNSDTINHGGSNYRKRRKEKVGIVAESRTQASLRQQNSVMQKRKLEEEKRESDEVFKLALEKERNAKKKSEGRAAKLEEEKAEKKRKEQDKKQKMEYEKQQLKRQEQARMIQVQNEFDQKLASEVAAAKLVIMKEAAEQKVLINKAAAGTKVEAKTSIKKNASLTVLSSATNDGGSPVMYQDTSNRAHSHIPPTVYNYDSGPPVSSQSNTSAFCYPADIYDRGPPVWLHNQSNNAAAPCSHPATYYHDGRGQTSGVPREDDPLEIFMRLRQAENSERTTRRLKLELKESRQDVEDVMSQRYDDIYTNLLKRNR